MRQFQLPALILVVALLLTGGFAPSFASAQSATPETADNLLDHAFTCSEEARQAGLMGVGEQPLNGGLVSPASAPGQDLYLLEVTVPAGACVWFEDHSLHDGAIVWYVKSGEVEFGIDLLEGSPPPDLTLLDSDGIAKPLATLMTLSAGDSLSADRAVGYAYRNDGSEDAVILMTVLENRWIWTGAEFSPIPDPMRDCRGHCRNIRR